MGGVFYPRAHAVLQVVFDGFGTPAADSPRTIIPTTPRTVSILRNGYHQPDSWDMTFDANDLPVDPNLIRAGGVDIWLYQDDALGDTRQQSALRGGLYGFQQDKPSIAGLFDQASLSLSSDGKWVSLRGQDYTALLMGKKWNKRPPTKVKGQEKAEAKLNGRRIPVGRTLDRILEELLAEADTEQRFAMAYRNLDLAEIPVVGAGETRSNRRGIPVDEGASYWDVMYRLATRYGYVLFFDAYDIVLTRPQNLTTEDVGRVRRMAWGRNIEELDLERNMGKEVVPRIVVQGYDQKTMTTITVEYPARAQPVGRVIGVSEDDYEMVPAPGISSVAVLTAIAKSRFESIGQTERRLILTTKDLKTLTGDQAEADLLKTAAGDAFILESNEVSPELLSDPSIPEARKLSHMLDRGFDPRVAAIIARSYAQGQPIFDRPMRVNEASLTYDVDDGVSIEVELLDFVAVDGLRGDNREPAARRARST